MSEPTISGSNVSYKLPGANFTQGPIQAHREEQSAWSPGQIISAITNVFSTESGSSSVDNIPVQIEGLDKPVFISEADYKGIAQGQKDKISYTLSMPDDSQLDDKGNPTIKTYPFPTLPPLKKE